jgi:hypothetical protein
MLLLVVIGAHPPALESIDLPTATASHVHDKGSVDSTGISHHVLHHDHHFEIAGDLTPDICGSKDCPRLFANEDNARIVQIYLDRPPRAAWS